MSREEFGVVIGTVAVATNRELDAETVEVYFASLCDVPLQTFQAACKRVVNGATFFPSVGEIRKACDGVKGEFASFAVPQLPPAAALRDDDPRLWYACVTCQDSGWASYWCPGSVNAQPKYPEMFVEVTACGSNACARFGQKGYGHEFVRRCSCYEHNPTIRQRLEARRVYAGHDAK